MQFLRGLYVLLWSFLFVIPGIIASYSYSMTAFIMIEHPDLSVNEAITRSKEIMRGNRWRLFCLQISFIGGQLLSALTCGIGFLFLRPYMNASFAAFYREISKGHESDNYYDEPHVDKDYVKNYNIHNNISN